MLLVIIMVISGFSSVVFSGTGTAVPEEYDLVIIAPACFADQLQKLVDHKNDFAMRTFLKTAEEIYDGYAGRDNAEQIKYFIKDAIETFGIKYVLLVGGRAPGLSEEHWYIPARYSNIVDNWMIPEFTYLSDLYFADIYDEHGDFSSWDTDQDGVYGEWSENQSADDICDLYPDVSVGRLACRNNFEVKVMVDKIISYETSADDSWFKKMVAVAGDTYPDNDYFEGENAALESLSYMTDFEQIKLFTSDGSLTGVRDVVTTLNQGCGFLLFLGHGSPYAWGTHPPYDDTDLIYGLKVHHMMFLQNKEKLPICVVGGCHNSMFNISLFHQFWTYGIPALESWSWWLTRALNGGSIATIGNTGLGYGKEDKRNPELGGGGDYLNVLFFKEYGENSPEFLGDVWGNAISMYLDEYPIDWLQYAFADTALDAKTVQQWVLLGDPSLKIGGYR